MYRMPMQNAKSRIPDELTAFGNTTPANTINSIALADYSTLPISVGSLIVNSKGVPGTLGCIAYSNNINRHVFLTNYHVLFGKYAKAEEDVWLVTYKGMQQDFYPIGKSLVGKIGIFQNGDQSAFIDCALGIFSDNVLKNEAFIKGSGTINIQGAAEAKIGEYVKKTGSATKYTTGIIASTEYHDVCNINGTIFQACNQILIKPAGAEKFSAKGDSGSAILNSRNEIVGLLWCVNEKEEGIACRIGPVMQQLNICFNINPLKRNLYYI
jgi:hypothetical protein